VEIAITPEGRRLMMRAPGVAQERLISALDSLSPGQRHLLARLLDRTVAAMGVGDQPAEFFFEDDRPSVRRLPGARDGRSAR
jgi:hypothetical protein